MSFFSFESSVFPQSVLVASFRGEEAISQIYAFEVNLVLMQDDCSSMDFGAAVGAKATLGIAAHQDAERRSIHGILADVELVHAAEGKAVVRVTLVPELFCLTNSRHSRMFTDLSIPDIIKDIFALSSLPSNSYALEFSANYKVEEHVCQYKESDYGFILRWMAREGMYYYFDHEGDREKLIITDDKNAHARLPSDAIRYWPTPSNDVTSGASFNTFEAAHQALPARVRTRDYNYAKPSLDVSGDSDVSDAGFDDVVIHGGRFFDPTDGARLAKIKAEAFLADQSIFEARGTVYGVRPGYLFELTAHPDAALDRVYLCTSVRHEGRQAGLSPELAKLVGAGFVEGYRVVVKAIADDVQFRAHSTNRTHTPRISGFEAGVVDGPGDSPYGQIDDAGRYNIKMHFDESDLDKGSASTWIRMMQPHAGAPEGFHFPLRKGTEVMVAFLGGDPDRPVIAGAIPNALTPSVVTSSNHTQNVVHTGSDNRIEIEDLAGKQYIDFETPPQKTFLHLGEPHEKHTHYIVENTQGDCKFEIGGNQDINVGGKLTEKVKGAVDETYASIQLTQIQGPQTTKATGAVTETYENMRMTCVLDNVTETYKAGHESTVTGPKVEIYASKQDTTVTGPTEEKVTGAHVKLSGPALHYHDGTMSTTVTGPVLQNFSGAVTLDYQDTTRTYANLTWLIPGGASLNAPNWNVQTPSETWLFAKEDKYWVKKNEFTGMCRAMAGFKFEICVAAAAVSGIKDELNGRVCAIKGPAIEKGAFAAEMGVLYIEVAGMKLIRGF
jgi:type VI secretion system secreted protein VgrG